MESGATRWPYSVTLRNVGQDKALLIGPNGKGININLNSKNTNPQKRSTGLITQHQTTTTPKPHLT